ncbi:MAG TPA: extracellular solute-binding protein [Crenalkalicoccus sp.]|nr:extracellular solute-binding protein [Crenalkalicoccus sp.]
MPEDMPGNDIRRHINRRGTLGLSAAALAAMALRQASAAIPTAAAEPPRLAVESGASLRILRPARFVEPDEVIFRENAQRFSQQFNVPVRVDFVSWEDLGAQTAVAANTGSGPDIVIGWGEYPAIYADKLVEVSDLAEYLGRKYGGWMFQAEKHGKRDRTANWISIPMGGSIGPIVYRGSAVREAGFESIPSDLGEFLRLCQALKRNGKPAGFALGNAVGDGNAFASWLIWAHGASLVDENGKVAISSPQTLAALNYLKELYPTFISGTLGWNDVSNNRAYAANELFLTGNGISLYYALKKDAATAAMAEDTEHALWPSGAAGSPPMRVLILNGMVFRHSRFPNAAKEFIRFMMEAEQYDRWLTGCLGYWSHPLEAYGRSAVWSSDPKLLVLRDAMGFRFWDGYKGPITQASGSVTAEYILVQMCAAVASGQATPEAAVREAERRTRRYYRG